MFCSARLGKLGAITIATCVTLVVLSLAGCANHPVDCSAGIYHSDCLVGTAGYQTPQDAWTRPDMSDDAASRQRSIDTAECQAYTMRSVQLPAPPANQNPAPITQSPNQYNVSGSINGVPYNATVTTQPSFNPAADMNAGTAYSDSLAQSEKYGAQYAAAVRARSQLSDACMLRLGWMKAPSH